jgi:DNA sulfur modification protein DndE
MKSPIETIRVSQKGKDQLTKLARHTKIQHRNVLCRWAFLTSLAESSVPPATQIPSDSNLEISWKVFGGKYADIYLALLQQRCKQDGLEMSPDVVATQFRLHLHRGLGYLVGRQDMRSIRQLLEPSVSHPY